jgi:hypothetical protein
LFKSMRPSTLTISFQKVTIFSRFVCAESTTFGNRRHMVQHHTDLN